MGIIRVDLSATAMTIEENKMATSVLKVIEGSMIFSSLATG